MNIEIHKIKKAEVACVRDDWFCVTITDENNSNATLYFYDTPAKHADAIVNAFNAATGYVA